MRYIAQARLEYGYFPPGRILTSLAPYLRRSNSTHCRRNRLPRAQLCNPPFFYLNVCNPPPPIRPPSQPLISPTQPVPLPLNRYYPLTHPPPPTPPLTLPLSSANVPGARTVSPLPPPSLHAQQARPVRKLPNPKRRSRAESQRALCGV